LFLIRNPQLENPRMFVDIFIIGMVVFAFYAGYTKGIIKTMFTVLGSVIALVATLKCTPAMAVILATILPAYSSLVPPLAFIVTFLVAILAVRIVARIFEDGLKAVNLNFINKTFGGLILAVLGVFLVSCLLTFLDKASLLTYSMKDTSQLYEHLQPIPETGFQMIKTAFPIVKDMFSGIIELFEQTPADGNSTTHSVN